MGFPYVRAHRSTSRAQTRNRICEMSNYASDSSNSVTQIPRWLIVLRFASTVEMNNWRLPERRLSRTFSY